MTHNTAARFRIFGILAGIMISATLAVAQSPGPGVSHELAISRASRVSDLHYDLHFDLKPHADTMPGTETLRFTLSNNSTYLAIDYRDGTISAASLNGQTIPATLTDGHLILPAKFLRAGENKFEATFSSRIATAGAAITRYEDKDDGNEYIYSLFVPMDASMAFPCFDQPDLKAKFKLSVQAPWGWTVIANTPGSEDSNGQTASFEFPESKPISTYLFAFAAGPWACVHFTPGQPNVYVRASQAKRAEPEVPQLQDITARGMAWLVDYFQQPFPFPKYDIVLIPGFPFGGMEHAGETFLREDVVLFRTAPTAADRFGRNITTLHELTHQWFGDLVTMRWFDDLWLKEGFAQYMAYRCLDSLQPNDGAWKHFYEDIKPQAYGIDETQGTTPIFQNIPNLKDAKSAYGAIVYQKAPAILKQLEFTLGQENFRNGLRLYLKQHAYANAQWSDLVDAFHTASGQDVRTWADSWVLHRGMPEVNVEWKCDAQGKIASMKLTQHDVLPEGYTWPISNEIQLGLGAEKLRVHWNQPEFNVAEAIGNPCPTFVFANAGDQGYGRFLLDEKSEVAAHRVVLSANDNKPLDILPETQTTSAFVPGEAGRISVHGTAKPNVPDPLLRSMLWGALWDNVHVAKSAPHSYVELALNNLTTEKDETLFRVIAGHTTTALHSYITGPMRTTLVSKFEIIATTRMQQSDAPGMRINSFRTLTGIAETPNGLLTLKQLLSGTLKVPGVELRQLDRWNLIGRLVALNDSDAGVIFASEQQRDKSGDGQKYAWSVQAGVPTTAAKEKYFAQYLLAPTDPTAKPEDWITQSLRPFNNWNQSALTEPYLRRALDQLPEIKRDRKIFFLGAWLGAFIGGQQSAQSLSVVREWLAQPGIDADLRLKVLESADELERTVRIRQRFPD